MFGAKLPTAVHADGPLQDTVFNVEEVPARPIGTGDQIDPFHDSLPELPMAMHDDGPLHDTPLRPLGVGGARNDRPR